MAFRELLYNRCNNPSKEFIGHLNPGTAKLIQRLFVMDDLITKHTMYPQYARFIPLQQKKNALYHIGYDFCDAHHLFAILPRTQADSQLKYCPLCVQEDRKNHREAYWHRKHQIRNMSICTKHMYSENYGLFTWYKSKNKVAQKRRYFTLYLQI